MYFIHQFLDSLKATVSLQRLPHNGSRYFREWLLGQHMQSESWMLPSAPLLKPQLNSGSSPGAPVWSKAGARPLCRRSWTPPKQCFCIIKNLFTSHPPKHAGISTPGLSWLQIRKWWDALSIGSTTCLSVACLSGWIHCLFMFPLYFWYLFVPLMIFTWLCMK